MGDGCQAGSSLAARNWLKGHVCEGIDLAWDGNVSAQTAHIYYTTSKERVKRKGLYLLIGITHDFTGTEVGTPPCRRVGCATIETTSTNAIIELSGSVVGVDDMGIVLAWERVGGPVRVATRVGLHTRNGQMGKSRGTVIWGVVL